MFFLEHFSDLQLDIVGIVAILGEASVSRTAQVSALSWHHVIPRLMPAPQALLKQRIEDRLPIEPGTVVGVYSGNLAHEHNFFCQLLHPEEPSKYAVELLSVIRDTNSKEKKPYDVRSLNVMLLLSLLGCALSIALVILASILEDGWALIGAILLSTTSSFVGAASKWTLNLKLPERKPLANIPDSDLVIFYPSQSAFRIVRCDESTARLYFTAETCEPSLSSYMYKVIALFSSVTLIFGLVCIGNAQQKCQIAFAAAYVILNIAYWSASALGWQYHWTHSYKVKKDKFYLPESKVAIGNAQSLTTKQAQVGPATDIEANKAALVQTQVAQVKPRIFTTALWEAIALTGSSQWIRRVRAVPQTETWEKWFELAGEASRMTSNATYSPTHATEVASTGQVEIEISDWPYREKLSELMGTAVSETSRRPAWSKRQLAKSAPGLIISA